MLVAGSAGAEAGTTRVPSLGDAAPGSWESGRTEPAGRPSLRGRPGGFPVGRRGGFRSLSGSGPGNETVSAAVVGVAGGSVIGWTVWPVSITEF